MTGQNRCCGLFCLLFSLLSLPAIAAVPIAGDVDGSGAVDAVDVQLVINAALGIKESYGCDIDYSRTVNAVDVQLVINAALGLIIDKDADGLCDAAEANLGTDPDDSDTDGDGIGDGEEMLDGTDPLVAEVTVPDVVGMTQSAAASAVTGAGLTVGTITELFSNTVPTGHVISHDPGAGTSVSPGTAVDLVVSKGPEPIAVPDLVGMEQVDAESAVVAAGLTVGLITEEYSDTAPTGFVISQDPSAGTLVLPGSVVDLVASKGPEPVPDLSVDTNAVSLSESSDSATVTVTNVGDGTLRWTAVSDDPAVTVTPDSFTGNSTQVTIGTSDFSQSYAAYVTFTNDNDPTDYEIIDVSVTGSDATEETIMLPGDVPLEMVWIPTGSFMMGAPVDEQDTSLEEWPQHTVTLPQGFWMGKYELTKAQWEAVMGTTPWAGQEDIIDDPDSPAVNVSWNDAQAFLTALNALKGGGTFRLPSEAEWEYACRAGTTTRFYWGDDPSYTQIGDYAWYRANAWDASERYAHVVGQKAPNAWGLYDMSGNVWEWCEDDWHDNYKGAPQDGSSWNYVPTALWRLYRGGSYGTSGQYCRSAFRLHSWWPDDAYPSSGFRVVWTP